MCVPRVVGSDLCGGEWCRTCRRPLYFSSICSGHIRRVTSPSVSVCLSACCLSVSVCLSLFLSLSASFCLCFYLCLSLSLSVSVSVSLSLSPLSLCLRLFLFLSQSLYRSVCLSEGERKREGWADMAGMNTRSCERDKFAAETGHSVSEPVTTE